MTVTYVVDRSLVIDALSARQDDEVLRQRLSAPRTLHAPHHLDVEVASTIRGLAAGKKITDRRGEQMLADYARCGSPPSRLALPPPDVGTAAQPRRL